MIVANWRRVCESDRQRGVVVSRPCAATGIQKRAVWVKISSHELKAVGLSSEDAHSYIARGCGCGGAVGAGQPGSRGAGCQHAARRIGSCWLDGSSTVTMSIAS